MRGTMSPEGEVTAEITTISLITGAVQLVFYRSSIFGFDRSANSLRVSGWTVNCRKS